MSNCIKKLNFHLKLLDTGFMANDKWRQTPGFDMLHHIFDGNIKNNIHLNT